MKLTLLSLMFFLFFSCTPNSYKISNDEKIANEIMKSVSLKLQKEKGLFPFGTGGGMMNEIKMLALSFNYYKPITIDEARGLLIYSVNEFVSEINACEEIRQYLANFPFEPRNVEIRIFIYKPDGTNVSEGDLSIISSIDNILRYKIDAPDGKKLITVQKETYEEAVQNLTKAIEGGFVDPGAAEGDVGFDGAVVVGAAGGDPALLRI